MRVEHRDRLLVVVAEDIDLAGHKALLAGRAGIRHALGRHIAGCSLAARRRSSPERMIAAEAGIEAVGNRPGRSRPAVEDIGRVTEEDTAGCCTGYIDRKGPTL